MQQRGRGTQRSAQNKKMSAPQSPQSPHSPHKSNWMLDQDSDDDDDKTTIRLRYLYRGEHKRDGRVATIACKDGTIKTKAVRAALRRDRSVDLDRFGVAVYDVKEEAWRTLTELDDEIYVEGEARAELYDTLETSEDATADEAS